MLSFTSHNRPDIVSQLTGDMDFTDVRVMGDPTAAQGPLENRIGRKLWDITPSDLTELALKNLFYARRDRCIRHFPYTSADGRVTRASLVAPTRDLVLITVRRLMMLGLPLIPLT